MTEQDQQVNNEAIVAIITNLCEGIHRNSTSKDGSMPGLQKRAREDLSNDNDTDSWGEDGMFDDDETWGYKALILSQIIGEKQLLYFLSAFQG